MPNFDHGEPRQNRGLLIASVSTFALLLIVGCVVATVYQFTNDDDDDDNHTLSARSMHSTSKSVQMICESTRYSGTCESSLSKAVNTSNPDPQELVKAAVAVVLDEMSKAFAHSALMKNNDSRVKGAIEDCRQLYVDAKDELLSSLASIVEGGLERLPARSHDIKNWLSAVMSYQQTCIDGFPEGELKAKMNAAMTKARQLTSNALAIIGQVAALVSTLDISEFQSRHLLTIQPAELPPTDHEGLPFWVPETDRRLLRQKHIRLIPNVTVAQDGTGNYTNITDALLNIPKIYDGRYVIYVKKGIYEETVNVTRKMHNVTMFGDGATKTIVTGSKNFIDGTRTFMTASFAALGDGFMGLQMGFRNTAGAGKHQAVALRVQSDRSIFLNCRMEGYQDTLYAQAHRQFYRNCVISGTVDFIFGDAAAVFQDSRILVRRPMDNQQNIVTAHGRIDPFETTGFVIQHCRIEPDSQLALPGGEKIRSYLGRPWKEFSRTIIMETEIGEFIHPEGYMPWSGDFGLKTLFYAEFNNVGMGSNVTARVTWPGFRVIDSEVAERFTAENFIQAREWVTADLGCPIRMSFFNKQAAK